MIVSNLKKYAICGIIAVLLLTVTACKGSEAKKVDRLIRDIGTVTVESKESIETAADAYNELSDEEKGLVTEYEHLQDARKKYRECLLDALEKDDLLSQVEATVSATMSNYSPKFTLNREERVLYFEVTSDQYSKDAVLFYPGLSYAFFSVLENNMCDISSQIYEVTQQYEVDSVVIMHGYYSEWGDLFKIRNGGIVESIL